MYIGSLTQGLGHKNQGNRSREKKREISNGVDKKEYLVTKDLGTI